MTYTASVAKRAAADVTHFLESTWPHTIAVHNVVTIPPTRRWIDYCGVS